MRPAWKIAVLIPARDEECLVGRCLRSVLDAIARLPDSSRASIVLVSDSSTDRTPQIATDLLGNAGVVLKTNAGTVGSARAIAAAHVISRTSTPLNRLWLANTDADCIVPPHWLVDQLFLADRGVEAIAGIVDVDSFDEHGPEVPARFRVSYVIDADGTHPHIHGANIGVRADCYLRAGGWADLQTAEDHDLWQRIRRMGGSTCSTAAIHVVTSGRRIGRAPHGFAGALAAHNESTLMA